MSTPIFSKRNGYLFDTQHQLDAVGLQKAVCKKKNLIFPLNIDTEFQSLHPLYDAGCGLKPTTTISAGCRGVMESVGLILAHPDIRAISRHPVFDSGFAPVDYLRHLGYEVELCRPDKLPPKQAKLPTFEFVLYAHFAVAELTKIVTTGYRTDVLTMASNAAPKPRFEQKRRLRSVSTITTPKGSFDRDSVTMPWLLTFAGTLYKVKICWIDTVGLHGVASYKDLCVNVGIPLDNKDVFSSFEKGKMLEMYQKRTDDFDAYALGDLNVYDVLLANAKLFETIYAELGIQDYYQPPKLTVGATVRDIFQAKLLQHFNINPQDVSKKDIREKVDLMCSSANASLLKEMVTTTACYNAKVRGGRCRNNRPIKTVETGLLVNIDIISCYAEGQRNQFYPAGNPMLIDYPINSDFNKYMSLREFLKHYRKITVPGLWQAVATTKPNVKLKYRQDFLASWIPPKSIRDMKCDSDLEDTNAVLNWLDNNDGETKIFNYEIQHGLIQEDFIEWLEYVASPQQRKELLDCLFVETAIIYPNTEEYTSTEKLLEKLASHKGENICELHIKREHSYKLMKTQECYAWLGVNIGKLLIDEVLKKREQYPKEKNLSLNTLYKLIGNTLYGDMVSPYFLISNVVVGNNVTARPRAFEWYMEKGFYGWQSITDSCVFNINRVVYPGKNTLTGVNTVNLYRQESGNINLKFKPLGGYKKIEIKEWIEGRPLLLLDGIIEISALDSHKWIAEKAMEHLRNLFPNVSVLHKETADINENKRVGQFGLEVEKCYTQAVFHGTGDYWLSSECSSTLKMRSYESKKEHGYYIIENDVLNCIASKEAPSIVFLKSLYTNPDALGRAKAFLKPTILKCGEFRELYGGKYSKTNLTPGDTEYITGLLKECSLSQFTFQDEKQYRAWMKEYNRLKRHYGQSFEMYFLNTDGTLRYQEMIEVIDKAIDQGKLGIVDELDPYRHKARKYRQTNHPEKEAWDRLKAKVEKEYEVIDVKTISADWEDFEDVDIDEEFLGHCDDVIYATADDIDW